MQGHHPVTALLFFVAYARVFLADAAVAVGLVDKIGYLQDAIAEARKLAALDVDARVVIYRRTDYPNDNLYNTLTSGTLADSTPQLVDLGLLGDLLALDAGFYYLWSQALGSP